MSIEYRFLRIFILQLFLRVVTDFIRILLLFLLLIRNDLLILLTIIYLQYILVKLSTILNKLISRFTKLRDQVISYFNQDFLFYKYIVLTTISPRALVPTFGRYLPFYYINLRSRYYALYSIVSSSIARFTIAKVRQYFLLPLSVLLLFLSSIILRTDNINVYRYDSIVRVTGAFQLLPVSLYCEPSPDKST